MPLWNNNIANRSVSRGATTPKTPPVSRFPFAHQISGLYAKVNLARKAAVQEDLLARIQVELAVDPEDLARIPKTGSVVAISDHAFGIFDAAVLLAALLRVRSDVKIIVPGSLRPA